MAKEVRLRQGWSDVADLLTSAEVTALVDLTALNVGPKDATYIVASSNATLTAERVATDTATIDVDIGTADQIKWNLIAPVTVASGGTGQTTEAEAVGELTQALTEDTTPDRQLDMAAVYDASADTGKKVALYNVAGMAVLATGTASGATGIDVPLDGYSNFTFFKLFIRDGTVETDGADLWLRVSDDGGTTFEEDAADYGWQSATAVDASDAQIVIETNGIGNAAGEGFCLELTIYNPAAAARTRFHASGSYVQADADTAYILCGGTSLAATATTDVRVMASTGGISGNWSLVGIL